VKTLAIQNTFEENIVAWRTARKTTQEKVLIEDDEIRNYIAVRFFLMAR
jgi:hypothetical protein